MNLWHRLSLCLLFIFILNSPALALDNKALIKIVQDEEHRLNAQIGVAIFDTQTNQTVSYKGNELFPLNSTHKTLICAALLKGFDNKQIDITEKVEFSKTDIIEYSPITKNQTKSKSMNWLDLCSAAVSYSDNTAANLIHKKVGGPQAMNHFFKQLKDHTTRLDRFEPELNSAINGDLRDTTSPNAIAYTLKELLFSNFLSPSSRKQLIQWMIDDKVADALLRSKLPNDWKIADKTGAGGFGSRGIIAAVWPKTDKPIIIAIYIKNTKANMEERNSSIAIIGKHIFDSYQKKK
ncbi:class A beta-lactamase [Bartonella sp. HY406]|uniref:class A beta-lactamase n=1 Tax=Bartonella sp. HY406 TaxID=2979331 RepID=UPI0021C7F514|nr:class A beta-lactamase [Bartonella sp. HY406]UXN02362.1 class A beta-lactamase [Bartonella sp. HY406]